MKQIEKVVYKWQTRIYKAKNCGDYKAVRRLQKTLINSRSAQLLATRKVTQDNQGKKTAGVDGIKSLVVLFCKGRRKIIQSIDDRDRGMIE